MPQHTIVGKRPLVGATNQASTPVEFTMSWLATDGTTKVNAVATVYKSPIFSSGSLKHDAEIKRLKDGKGGRVTVIASDQTLTLDVVAVPVGSGGATAADNLNNAIASAQLPAALGFCTIASAPVISFGGFTDALNSANWLYEGGGSVEIASDGEWGLKFTVVRSANISAQAAVDL